MEQLVFRISKICTRICTYSLCICINKAKLIDFFWMVKQAEGLLVELNISSCYDFVEQCIMCISAQLSSMENQRFVCHATYSGIASFIFKTKNLPCFRRKFFLPWLIWLKCLTKFFAAYLLPLLLSWDFRIILFVFFFISGNALLSAEKLYHL